MKKLAEMSSERLSKNKFTLTVMCIFFGITILISIYGHTLIARTDTDLLSSPTTFMLIGFPLALGYGIYGIRKINNEINKRGLK